MSEAQTGMTSNDTSPTPSTSPQAGGAGAETFSLLLSIAMGTIAIIANSH
jgi:hypothetical protein